MSSQENFSSHLQVFLDDLSLTNMVLPEGKRRQLVSDMNTFLIEERNVKETEATLASLVSSSNLKWTDSDKDKLKLDFTDLSKKEKYDRRIACFLSWWINGKLDDLSISKDKWQIQSQAEKIERLHIFLDIKDRMVNLGLVGDLGNISLHLLDKGQMQSKFCKKGETKGEQMFIVAANYFSGFAKYPVYSVFGINSSRIDKTVHIELPNKIKDTLGRKEWLRWRDSRNVFYNE